MNEYTDIFTNHDTNFMKLRVSFAKFASTTQPTEHSSKHTVKDLGNADHILTTMGFCINSETLNENSLQQHPFLEPP